MLSRLTGLKSIKNYKHREMLYTSSHLIKINSIPIQSHPIPLIAPRCYIHLRWRFLQRLHVCKRKIEFPLKPKSSLTPGAAYAK